MKFLIRFKHLSVSADQLYRYIEIDKVDVLSMLLNNLLQGPLPPAKASAEEEWHLAGVPQNHHFMHQIGP